VPFLSFQTKVDGAQSVRDGMYVGGGNYGGGMDGAAVGGVTTPESVYRYRGYHQHGQGGGLEVDYGAGGGGTMMGQHQHHHLSQQNSSYRAGKYDGMALSDGFLHEYYSHVSQMH